MPVEIRRRLDITSNQRPATAGGRVVYAIGDVHGCYDLLVGLLRAIAEDVAALAPARAPLLLFVGDYVDRGPRSAEVLTTLIWLSRHAAFEIAFLRGNHEAMLLAFLHQPEEAAGWLRFGGAETLRAYGVDVPEEEGPETCRRLRDMFMDRLPASHLEFLQTLRTQVTCGDYVFVHAGLRPGVPLRRQCDEDRLWIREEFLNTDHAFERIVVHGHSWGSDAPVLTPHRIGIDTGAYQTGALTAVRLGTPRIEFIQARAKDENDAEPSCDKDGRSGTGRGDG